MAGAVISEDNLWNLVKAIRAAELKSFGDYFHNVLSGETKAKKLLKRKRFKIAGMSCDIPRRESVALAHSLLVKGKQARLERKSSAGETRREMIAYSRAVLGFVHDVLDIAANHNVEIIASVVDIDAPRPPSGMLRKDYVYLFERYFYLLERYSPSERGLVVFDELEKSQSHLLIRQMQGYFLETSTGRYRSSRVIPEPFFVHSDLTTGVFLADLVAYILGWGWRINSMPQPRRAELTPYADKIHQMQFRGEKPKSSGRGTWKLFGIRYIDDLRGQLDRV